MKQSHATGMRSTVIIHACGAADDATDDAADDAAADDAAGDAADAAADDAACQHFRD